MLVPFHIHTKFTCHCDVDTPKQVLSPIPKPRDERLISLCATLNENTGSLQAQKFGNFCRSERQTATRKNWENTRAL